MRPQLNRRALLQGLSAALAITMSPELLVGTATAGGMSGHVTKTEQIPAFLADLDARMAPLASIEVPAPLAELLRGMGLPERLCLRLTEQVTRISAFRDLPPELQAHPEMQRRIRHDLPRFGQQVLGLARALRELPVPSRRRVRRLMLENPGLRTALREQKRRGLSLAGVPAERIHQHDLLYNRILFRLERQDPSVPIDELLDRVRRASRDAGLPEDTWDAALALDLDAVEREGGQEELWAGELVLATDPEETSNEGDGPPEDQPRRPRPRTVYGAVAMLGAIAAGVGLLSFGLGLLLLQSTEAAGVFLTTFGLTIVVLGVAFLGLSLLMFVFDELKRRRQEGREQEDASLVLPPELLAALREGGIPAVHALAVA